MADAAWWQERLQPVRVVDPQQTFTYQAESPREAWERLAMLFESGENLRSHLAKHGPFDLPAKQAEHIGASLRQGREWFRVAMGGELMARPVAVYYGMVSFAAAVAMSWGAPKTLDGFKKGHGLSFNNLGTIDGAAVETSGDGFLFQTFCKIAAERSSFAAKIRRGSLSLSFDVRAAEQFKPVSLQAILARLPSLADYYRQTFAAGLRSGTPMQRCEAQFPLDALGFLMRGTVRVTPRRPAVWS